jgi:pyruvate dehydrogenase E1 component
MNIRPGHEWDKFEGLGLAPNELQQFLERVPFAAAAARQPSRAHRGAGGLGR